MAEKGGGNQEIEQQLERAICARLQLFRNEADSLTMESVRRLLEKDLDLEKLSLDAHRRFIKLYLEKKLSDDDCKSEAAAEDVDKVVNFSKAPLLSKQHEEIIDQKNSSKGDEEPMKESPIMGVLSPKSEVATQGSSISERSIKKAIWERADYFEANSANITLGGVRRLLEEDLGLEKNTLDPFKKFISQQIDQVLSSPKQAKSVKDSKKNTSKDKRSKTVSSEEESESSHSGDEMEVKVQPKKEAASKGNAKKMDQSKKRKLSKESDLSVSDKKQNKAAKREKEESNCNEDGSASEDGQSRSSVEKSAQVLSSPKQAKSVENSKKKALDTSKAETLKTFSSEEESDSSHSGDEMEVKAQPKKEAASKGKAKKVKESKKRKLSKESDLPLSGKTQNQVAKWEKEENNSNEDGSASEDGQSRSSVEKSAQRKEKTASGYGKKVENLKSKIKACGMSVPPSLYKKAKQVSEEEREAFIVKELEGILTREGLSKNPTEKEIKECKKRKDRAKELEGIDMSNIISSSRSRRRSTFRFEPPVTPGSAKKDKVEAKATKKKDNNDEDDRDENEHEDKEEKENNEDDAVDDEDDAVDDEDDAVDDEDDAVDDEDDEVEEDESEDFNEDDDEDSD